MDYVDDYISSKKLAWARTSLKNERARLNKHGGRVLDEPSVVYADLKTRMKPYSIKTTFVRLGKFYEYLVENDKIPALKNPWKAFLTTNAMLFKHAYQTERLQVTYAEARARIDGIIDPSWRQASLQLLEGGLRYCELRTFDGERVIGKGSKPRAVFLSDDLNKFKYTGSYTALYKSLKQVDLKP